jgi:hypothetical protein
MPGQVSAPHRFVLVLDNQDVALDEIDGGHIRGEVVSVLTGGASQPASKSIGSLRLEPFKVRVGGPVAAPVAEWIRACADLKPVRKNGSIAAVGADLTIKSQRQFRDALIEEITFPALDASSKDAIALTISFQAGDISYTPGNNAIAAASSVKLKRWISSNFRFRLGDLPCNRVSRVDSFTITQRFSESVQGSERIPTKQAATVDFPNLKVTFSATDAAAWQQWFNDFVVKASGKELQGSLEFLGPDLAEVIGRIELSQVGIFALYDEKASAGSETVARCVAELYVEKMTFKL